MKWITTKGKIELTPTESTSSISEKLKLLYQYYQTGNLQKAEAVCKSILQEQPQNSDAFHYLGLIAHKINNNELAIQLIKKAISIRPDIPDYYNNCGTIYQACGYYDLASAQYEKTLKIKPDFIEAIINLGAINLQINQIDEAIKYFKLSLQLKPNSAESYCNMGYALTCLGKPDESIRYLGHALKIKPGFIQALNNLGTAYLKNGNIKASINSFKKVIKLNSDNPEANYNLSCIELLKGNYKKGWINYEWRFKAKNTNIKKKYISQPEWNGEQISSMTILIYSEQGFGDIIQFIRYIIPLSEKANKIILQVNNNLKRLLSSFSQYAIVIGNNEEPPEFDIHASLLSLPRLLGTSLDNIPIKIPYIKAEDKKIIFWHDKLANIKEKKIGICWQGTSTHYNDKYRSLSLNLFEPLMNIPDLKLISLQKGYGTEQIDEFGYSKKIISFNNEFDNGPDSFIDSCAIIKNLDLVISIDTSITHLAGAMGKPTWVLLSVSSDWRWLLDRTDSPWYPSLQLYRQKKLGDWESVFNNVIFDLEKFIIE